jgi:hypothetical protein
VGTFLLTLTPPKIPSDSESMTPTLTQQPWSFAIFVCKACTGITLHVTILVKMSTYERWFSH